MSRPFWTSALLLLPLIFAGCARKADTDPHVRDAVEQFWQSVIEPDLHPATARPVLKSAYQQLHPDARQQQTLTGFGDQWIRWIQAQGPGWVLSAEIESAEATSDSVIVVVKLTVGDASGLEPEGLNEETLVRMTLRKDKSAWRVFSAEEGPPLQGD